MASEVERTQTGDLVRLDTESLTTAHWAAILMALITGIIHVYLWTTEGFPLFLLGGLGFFGAIGLVLILPYYRRYLYLIGVPYTLMFIVGWLAQGMPSFTIGVIDKAVEVMLIALLVYLYIKDA